MASKSPKKVIRPAQHQSHQPGDESKMTPLPESLDSDYLASGKLKDKVAIITGGDSGIGRAIAFLYALEGANVVISYLDEHEDAELTKKTIESVGRSCLILSGDIADPQFCEKIVKETIKKFKK